MKAVLIGYLWTGAVVMLVSGSALAQFPLPDSFNPGADTGIFSLVPQADGRILAGGIFTTLGGQARNRIGRLNADGSLDLDFDPGANDSVQAVAVQPDGKILVSGSFSTLGGQPRKLLGRLNVDGTLDSAFEAGANGPTYSAVYALLVQPDGKILVGGNFTTLGGQPRNYLGRLNSDGTLDAGFNPRADASVLSLAQQTDGKILAGGNFTTLGGQPRSRIARLNADGTVDEGFNPAASHWVNAVVIHSRRLAIDWRPPPAGRHSQGARLC